MGLCLGTSVAEVGSGLFLTRVQTLHSYGRRTTMDDSIICLNKLVNLVIFHSNVELPEGICNKVSITIRMVVLAL